MSTFKPQQRHLTIKGRAFHFVSYEARSANERRGEKAEPSMWYLMVEGHRRPTVPCHPDQPETEVDKALLRWVEDQDLTAPPPAPPPTRSTRRSQPSRRINWWGEG